MNNINKTEEKERTNRKKAFNDIIKKYFSEDRFCHNIRRAYYCTKNWVGEKEGYYECNHVYDRKDITNCVEINNKMYLRCNLKESTPGNGKDGNLIEKVNEKIKEYLPCARFCHSLEVVYCCERNGLLVKELLDCKKVEYDCSHVYDRNNEGLLVKFVIYNKEQKIFETKYLVNCDLKEGMEGKIEKDVK